MPSSSATRTAYRIIATDPGYGRVGFAVLEKAPGGESLIFSECFETSVELDRPARLSLVQKRLRALIKKFSPEALAIESLFFSKNQKTALAVAEARGVITGEAAAAELSIFEYSPMAVKIAVTGYGRADKKQVQAMVERVLKLESAKRLDDEYDAIAVGLAHLASYRPR